MTHQTTFTLFDSPLKREYIIDAFFRLAISPGDIFDWRSVRQIAAELGIPKSTRLHKLLQHMLAEGMLEFKPHKLPNGVDAHLYRLSQNYVESLK